MTRVLYLDCFSGASGDMLLGALLDAGLSLEALTAEIAKLKLPGVSLALTPTLSHGITGSKFDVVDTAQEHPARHLSSIRAILAASELAPRVVERSLRVFERLAAAEAKIHGTTLDEVHFHEIGAVDSLVDIVGFCVGLELLGIETVYASPLPLGNGTIRTAHGLIPVPVPATLALIAQVGAPTLPTTATTELVTPTGAALITTLATFERPALRVEAVGYGFGSRALPWANMLRAWIGTATASSTTEPAHTHALVPDHAHEHEHPHEHDHGHDHAYVHPHEHDHAHGHDHAHPHPHEEGEAHAHHDEKG
jgi:pyridinium-3,5-bisthiocarboxylic acid mononucleotide nickel chelatase